MRLLPIALLFALLTAAAAAAETITITAPWTQVRRTPSPEGRAIDIVYGNDTFEVLESQSGWVKVRTARDVTGWVPADPAAQAIRSTAPAPRKPAAPAPAPARSGEQKASAPAAATPKTPEGLRAAALSNGISLRQLGYREQSREKFTELMLSHPGTAEAYEATRQMLSYYLVGYLPPLQQGKITEEGAANIGPVSADVLLQEAIALQAEKHHARSARVYEALLVKNPGNGRAFLGLLDTLQKAMADSVKNKRQQDLDKQAATFKTYFPGLPLPEGVQG
jgi:hypothetical protein